MKKSESAKTAAAFISCDELEALTKSDPQNVRILDCTVAMGKEVAAIS